MGLANKLEEMRKEGGDHWLSIWNADIMVSVLLMFTQLQYSVMYVH